MKLILGGYANGRTAYAMQNYQLTESDCFDAAAEPPAPGDRQRPLPPSGAKVNLWLEQGKKPCTEILPWLERWQNAVLITQEVGCGLVPVTPQQRQLREAVGHFNRLLAECAETVERVCCGLGMQLK